MVLSLILSIAVIAVGIIGSYIGIYKIRMASGKLRVAGIFLICAILIIVIEEIISVMNLLNTANTIIYKEILHLVLVLFMFLAILFGKLMIDKVQKSIKK